MMRGMGFLRDWLPGPRLLAMSVAAILVASIVLGALALVWNAHVALAGYIGMMFLSAAVSRLGFPEQLLAAAWAVLVCAAGVLLAPLGPWAILAGVIVVSLGQAYFVSGGAAGIAWSPASLVAFGAFSQAGPIWQPMLGTAIGAGAMIAVGVFMTRRPIAVDPAPLVRRLRYGLALAAGTAILTGIWQITQMRYASFALLTYCLLLTFDPSSVVRKTRLRMLGAVSGAVTAVILATVLPIPAIWVLMLASAVLTVAYLLETDDLRYMTTLVISLIFIGVLSSERTAVAEGAHRLFAVLAAAGVALAVHGITVLWGRIRVAR